MSRLRNLISRMIGYDKTDTPERVDELWVAGMEVLMAPHEDHPAFRRLVRALEQTCSRPKRQP